MNRLSQFPLFIDLFLLIVLVAAPSCTKDNQTGAARDNQVVVIFQDCRDQRVASRFGGKITAAGEKTISYVDADGQLVKYNPRSMGADTLVIPTYGGYAELMHLYAVEESIFWLLKGGDTVLVTVGAKGRPQLSSRNPENTWLYNLPWHDPRSIHANGSLSWCTRKSLQIGDHMDIVFMASLD